MQSHSTGRTPVLVDEVRAIGDQAAGGGEVAFIIDGGNLVPRRQLDDQVAMNCCSRGCRYDQAAVCGAGDACDAALNLTRSRTSIGLTSICNEGATAWMAPS